MCVSPRRSEVAIVSSEMEITFYDLKTGVSLRQYNMNSYEDNIIQARNDYTALEAEDMAGLMTKTALHSDPCRSKSAPNRRLP